MTICTAGPTSACVTAVFLLVLIGCEGEKSNGPSRAWDWRATLDFGRRPRWDPAGQRILFGDDTPGRAGLWVWDLTRDPQPLGDRLPPHNWDYRWSPGGAQVAFSSPAAPEDSASGVWVVEVESGRFWRVWDRGRDVSWGEAGSALVFRIDNPPVGIAGVYALTLTDTTGPRLIAAGGMRPLCAPSSGLVAYSDGEVDGRLWIAGGASEPRLVSLVGASEWAWSAGGSYLFFVVNHYSSGAIRGDLWRISGQAVVSADSLTSYMAYPAPDGDGGQVAFLRSSGGVWAGLWLRRIGGEDVQVAPYGNNPDFDPTGDRIAVNAPGGGIRVLARVG